MRQVVILVEGQTEEALVKEVLGPAASKQRIYLQPVIVKTSETPKATHHGGGNWKHYGKMLKLFSAQKQWWRIGLLIDYYKYPAGAPDLNVEAPSESRQRRPAVGAHGCSARRVPGPALPSAHRPP